MSVECQDHLGNQFKSEAKMCEAHGVNQHTFRSRIRFGMPLEKALSAEPQRADYSVSGPDGKTYPSKKALREAYGTNGATVCRFRKKGLSEEQALVLAARQHAERGSLRRKRIAVAYEGNTYPNAAAFARAIGEDPGTVRARLKKGQTPDEIAKEAHRRKRCTDPLGKKHPTTVSMCAYWHISTDRYNYYARNPMNDPVAKACATAWAGKTAGPYRIIKCVQFPWFQCSDETGRSIVLHAAVLRELL